MKKVRIEQLNEPKIRSIFLKDKFYWVWLGNGTKHRFTNRKHAEAFLAQTNRFLNERVFELNRLYVEIFAEYRRLWFYFDNHSVVSNEKIENLLEWTNKKFNILIERSSGVNGNFNAFQNMRILIDNLLEVVKVLEELQQRKNNWVEKYSLAVIATRLNELENALAKYENEAQ